MKISIGIVNYNRLFYLRSCVKSLLYSVGDLDCEFICIDDNSHEKGTAEYLKDLKSQGWLVINQQDFRDGDKPQEYTEPITAFAESLNILYRESSGDLIIPLQGDMQFIRKGWLEEVISLFSATQNVGSVVLDAQRRVRLENNCVFQKFKTDNYEYFMDLHNSGINGGGDTVYSRSFLDRLGGWQFSDEVNYEDLFTQRAHAIFGNSMLRYNFKVPASISIYTDPRGTNARIRGNKRFGSYWEGKDDLYYKYIDPQDFSGDLNRPYSIEEVASPHGDWALPIDNLGNWKKNPLDTHTSTDFELI